jgi:hypothetical protein
MSLALQTTGRLLNAGYPDFPLRSVTVRTFLGDGNWLVQLTFGAGEHGVTIGLGKKNFEGGTYANAIDRGIRKALKERKK